MCGVGWLLCTLCGQEGWQCEDSCLHSPSPIGQVWELKETPRPGKASLVSTVSHLVNGRGGSTGIMSCVCSKDSTAHGL